MKAIPVLRAARGGLSGRRVQALVIGFVLLAFTAASTLALGLLADSNAPFDHAFAAQHGADIAVTVTGAASAKLAATTRVPGVTASAGPFQQTTTEFSTQITPSAPGTPLAVHQQLTVIGRASPGGPVDDVTLTAGHWAQGPGQIVWASGQPGLQLGVGSHITATGVPGSPKLTVVGLATSVTGTAQGWVTPAEVTTLHTAGTPELSQLLYRFSRAATAAEVKTDTAAVSAVLPAWPGRSPGRLASWSP